MFRGQNWAQVEFSPTEADKPKWNARGAKVLDGGAEALEEALRLSLQPEGQDGEANGEEREEEGGKRKLKEKGEEPASKKRKPNEEGDEEEGSGAGEDEEDEGLQDVYAAVRPPLKHNQVQSLIYLVLNSTKYFSPSSPQFWNSWTLTSPLSKLWSRTDLR